MKGQRDPGGESSNGRIILHMQRTRAPGGELASLSMRGRKRAKRGKVSESRLPGGHAKIRHEGTGKSRQG